MLSGRNLLRRLVPKSQSQRSGAMLAGGAIFAQAIQAVVTPVLGRLYQPAVFGAWALVQSIAAIPAALGGFRYELAIILADDERETINVLALQMLCNCATTTGSLAVVMLLRHSIAAALGAPALANWLFAV